MADQEKKDRVLAWGEFDDLLHAAFPYAGLPANVQMGEVVLGGKLHIMFSFPIDEIPHCMHISPQFHFEKWLKNRFKP